MPNADRGHLPRLPDAAYLGRVVVHWSMTIQHRETGWLTTDFHDHFRALLHHNAQHYAVVVPVHCLMPDHLHIVSAGPTEASDHQLWCRSVRRKCNEALLPHKLQKQAHDRVLRPAESGRDAFATLVHYICQNPVRAGLVGRPED